MLISSYAVALLLGKTLLNQTLGLDRAVASRNCTWVGKAASRVGRQSLSTVWLCKGVMVKAGRSGSRRLAADWPGLQSCELACGVPEAVLRPMHTNETVLLQVCVYDGGTG